MTSTIRVRVDDDLKVKVDELFRDLGTDTTIAIPYEALSETEMLDKLEKSREHATQRKFKVATDVSRNMRAKYGL